jgi:hypothetical protein
MAILAKWDFRGAGGQTAVAPVSVEPGVTAATGIGSGLLAINDLKNGLVGRKQTKTTLADAKADNEYVSFTLTPAADKSLTITEVKLRPVSQNQPRTFTLTANGRDIENFTLGTIFLPLKSISVRDISDVTVPVEFRLYIYGKTNEWESVGIGERQAGVNEMDLIVTGEVKERRKIQPPTNLAASNGTASSFTLSWTASTGAASYEVFANGSSRGTTAATSMSITGLAAGTYSMTVKAKNAAGNTSADSVALSVQIGISRSRMGINLTGVYDYSEEQPFKDVFKSSRPWNYDSNPGALSIDANGWVRSLNGQASAIAYLMVNENNPADIYEAGPYVLLYEGEGTIALAGAGVSRISFAPGRIEYNITQPGNHWVEITATNANNYIRNIRLVPKIYEADYQTNPWRPYILNLWSQFKTLRFMDWMNTNNSLQINWADRTPTSRATYSSYNPASSGIPLELITDLSNRLHADAWINIPHRASNDYVTQLATYLRDHLDRTLKIYVEYSNECWNPQFEQARYCEQNGRAAYPQFTPFEAQLRWYSRRSVEIFKIFATVFGGTSRLVRTLGAQQGNPWTVDVVLNHDDAANNTDAVAIAPYFGHEYACDKYQQVKTWTLAQFFNDIKTVSLPLAWKNTKDCISIIKAKGKLAVAYEGGQHFTGAASWACNGVDTFEDAALNSKFYDANVNAEMGNVYTMDLNKWRELGGDMYCAFSAVGNYSKHGYWGLLRFPNQNPSTAPKYQAVLNWLRNNPA